MKILHFFLRILLTLVYAAAIAIAADVLTGIFSNGITFRTYWIVFLASFVLLLLWKSLYKRFWITIPAAAVAGIVLVASMYSFYLKGSYSVEDNGKHQLYAGKDVLVLVPHQDDELLVAGGILEEYLKYGSNVSFAFSTTGDARTPGEVRMTEALQVASAFGIPDERVYFLGYGDRCISGVHMYNAPDHLVVASQSGFTGTYGLSSHPPYRSNREYTKANMRADIKELLLELKADIIYCVEVESHPDHSALSLTLDEAMAEILKESSDYQPIVMKSSCYATGFHAEEDFYSSNLKATADPTNARDFTNVWNWDERVRLPINGSGLSRSIFGCDTFQHFSLHKSQYVQLKAEGAINGDKVFWLRDTGSLCYRAEVSTSSGTGRFLNDFKLYDNDDVNGDFRNLSDNTWSPDAHDREKTAVVTLPERADIQRICLYDDPDMEINVLNALICFDDGSAIETGALNRNSVTTIPVNKDGVKSFTVKLLETEGQGAGLTEIEAYRSQRDYGFDFVKIQNMDGDFVYDYYIDRQGSEQFCIYASGVEGEFQVSSSNARCPVKYENGIITVECPKNESCTISVVSEDGEFSDTVVISNPGSFMRKIGPWLEATVRQYRKNGFLYCNSYQLLQAVYHFLT